MKRQMKLQIAPLVKSVPSKENSMDRIMVISKLYYDDDGSTR